MALALLLGIAGTALVLRRLISQSRPTTTLALHVLPDHAEVQLDGLPTTATTVDLVPGTAHILAAQAAGHVSAELRFTAERGARIDLALPQAVWPLDDKDPPPLRDELAAIPPTPLPAWEELSRRSAYLELHRDCLGFRQRSDCEPLRDRARALDTAAPRVDAAAEAYLRALASRSDVARAEGTLRAELLAERARVEASSLALLAAAGRPDDARRLLAAARAYLRGGGDQHRAEAAALAESVRAGGDRELGSAAANLIASWKRRADAVAAYNKLAALYNRSTVRWE
jgi:hypothetical protein